MLDTIFSYLDPAQSRRIRLVSRHAYNKGIREKVAYLTCVVPDKERPDYIATIDLDPDSSSISLIESTDHADPLKPHLLHGHLPPVHALPGG